MSVRVLESHDRELAVLYDSVTMVAFGPVILRGEDGESAEQMADLFLDHQERVSGKDIRTVEPWLIETRYRRWLQRRNQPAADHIDEGFDDETGLTAIQRMSLGKGW